MLAKKSRDLHEWRTFERQTRHAPREPTLNVLSRNSTYRWQHSHFVRAHGCTISSVDRHRGFVLDRSGWRASRIRLGSGGPGVGCDVCGGTGWRCRIRHSFHCDLALSYHHVHDTFVARH
jgi:hypothetical protein